VTLHGEQLRTDFRVINTDDKPFTFTSALHTYFEVGARGLGPSGGSGFRAVSWGSAISWGSNNTAQL
jgi:glucose-6-phosphate 1-epimerase